VFAGQRVGIKEVDDGIWIVSFMRYDLGYIDLEQRTLQPLEPEPELKLLLDKLRLELPAQPPPKITAKPPRSQALV
jgi:hypothetical protein